MCPFSHGMLLALVICLQFGKVNSSPINKIQRDDHKGRQPFQSTQLPPYLPPQGTTEGKHNYLPGSEKQIENAKQTASLKQANRVVFPYEKQRDPNDKNLISFLLNWYSFQSKSKKRFDINDVRNSVSKNAPLNRHRQHVQHFVQREHFRKLKAAHLESCKVCGLKFDHKRARLPGQHRKPQFDNSRARLSQSQGHKRKSLRTPNFLPTYHFKSFYHFSRRKRSPKKHKGLKKNKSNKDDLKDKDVKSLKESAHRNSSLTASGEDRAKRGHAGQSAKQTTAGTWQTPFTATGSGSSSSSSSSSVTPRRPSVSQEWTAGHTQGDVKDSGLEVELSESERQGFVDSSLLELKTSASGLDDEFDVENDTYLGLDGQPVDITEFLDTLKKKEFQRQLNREAQWAYLCLVLLMCLMMWMIWWLGGLDRCRYRPDDLVRFTDLQPKVTVQEVLQKKRAYLPMFSEPEWEEVLMCNRGNDP